MCTECQKWNQIHDMETQEIRHNVGSESVGWPEHRLHTWTGQSLKQRPLGVLLTIFVFIFPLQFGAPDSSNHRSNGPGALFLAGQFCGSRRPNTDETEMIEQT